MLFRSKVNKKVNKVNKKVNKINKKVNKVNKKINKVNRRNIKIEIRPILSYRGSFPSHLDRTVKLRVRISSTTNTAALCRG